MCVYERETKKGEAEREREGVWGGRWAASKLKPKLFGPYFPFLGAFCGW